MSSDVNRSPEELLDAQRLRRTVRYRHLEFLRTVTSRSGGESCMFATFEEAAGGVQVAANAAGHSHVGGVMRCSSPWSCPVCAPTIGERRAAEIDAAVSAWRAGGGHVFFVTATLSHRWGDDLCSLLDMLQGAWSRTFRWGGGVAPSWYAGQTRAVEITYGKNGWHPHVHSLVFVEAGWDDCIDVIRREIVDTAFVWGQSVEVYGGRTDVTSELCAGWVVKDVHDADGISSYLTKVEGGWGAGLELARLDLKSGKGLTPFDLLTAAVAGDRRALRVFLRYEAATAGRKRIVTTRGLFERCDVEPMSEEDAAVAKLEGEPVAVAAIPGRDWNKLARAGFVSRILDDISNVALRVPNSWPWPAEWLTLKPPDQPGG